VRYVRMTQREQLILWLGDAHAMEVGIVTTLEKHMADAKGVPKVRAALANHLKETKRHAAEMKKALASLGGSHPVVREGVSKLGNLAAGLLTSAAADTMVKNALADFATEHFEMACYNSLIFTATALGETAIAATCKSILKDEKAMAALLASQLKEVNDTYLATLDKDEPKASRGKSAAPKRSAAPKGRAAFKSPAAEKSKPKSKPAARSAK
jgi:ferritin-like metal-binding protein YciE